MFTKTKALPRVLDFSQAKYYIFSLAFTALAVFAPWAAHQFQIAGQIFLPMHLFILIGGFLFGRRTGLAVGLISPILSYFLTQMPALPLLPQIMIELAVYGLAIGILREKKMNIWVSLLSAMVLGRAARIVFIMFFASQMNVLEFIKISMPGIFLQIALIPLAVYFVQKIILDKNNGRKI